MKMRTQIFVLSGVAVAITAAAAFAQRIDARRPLTLTVGQPGGPEPTVRGGAHRDGLVHSPLPHGPLKVDWRFAIGGGQIEQPPLVTTEAIIVISTHGEAVWVPHDAHEGRSELARQALGIAASSTTPPAVLSGGTVVVAGGTTDAVAVGVDKTGIRFRTQLAGSIATPVDALDAVAPLALEDGGVAIATSTEIALLDSSGNVRMRAALPEPLVGALLAGGGASPSTRRILGVGKTGVVYAWSPGGTNGRDVARVGSFQGGISGGAVLTSDDTLLAIVDNGRMMTLDVRQGLAVPIASFTGGGYLGPVAMRHGVAYAMAGIPGRTFVIGIDSGGQEVLRTGVATSPSIGADGGVLFYQTPIHVPVVVDDTGIIAFAAPEGAVGVVDAAGTASSLDAICPRALRGGRGVTALVSGGPGAFIVTCGTGTVVRIIHGGGGDPP